LKSERKEHNNKLYLLIIFDNTLKLFEMLPRFYANGDTPKLIMTVQLITLFVGSIVVITQTFFMSTMVWTSSDLTADMIPYYDILPTTLKADWMIGINNIIYFVFTLIKTEWVLFVLVTLVAFFGCKRKYVIPVCGVINLVLAIMMSVRTIFFALSWLDCGNWAFCRTTSIPYLPYATTRKNVYFQLVGFGTLVLMVIEILNVILLYFLNTSITKVKIEEEENGAIENTAGIKFIFPTFYVPDDGVKLYISFILIMSLLNFVLFWFINWYIDRFVWTFVDLPVSYIPYYAILPNWMQSSVLVGYSDICYFIITSLRYSSAFYSIVGFIAISGCKRKYTYPLVLGFMVLMLFFDLLKVGFLTWCWFDFANWPFVRTTVSPYNALTRNFYFDVVWISSILVIIFAVVLTILIYTLKLEIATIVVDERDAGIIQISGGIHSDSDSDDKTTHHDNVDMCMERLYNIMTCGIICRRKPN
jgi:hypothetical protein